MREIIWERIWIVITKSMTTKNVYGKCQVNFISFQDIESIMEMFIRFANIEDDLQTLRKVHTKSEKLMNI